MANRMSINVMLVAAVVLAVSSTVSAINFKSNSVGVGKWKKWTTYIKLEGNYLCGASLMDENWIMTAADCLAFSNSNSPVSEKNGVTTPSFVKVYLGDHNTTVDVQQQQVRSCNWAKNPKYDSLTKAYDVAMLQLERPAAMDRDNIAKVPPATSLIKQKILKQSDCVLTGWVTNSGSPTDGVNLPIKIMNSAKCTGLAGFDENQHVCYEAVDGYPCPGDLGLPITCEVDGKWTQVGIQLSMACAPGYHYGAAVYKSRKFIDETKTTLNNQTCRDPPPDEGCGPAGKSFLVSFPAPDPLGSRPTLYITSWKDTSIRLVLGADLVSVFANFVTMYKVTAFNGLVINLPASLAIHSNGISSKSLRVVSNDDLYVMVGYEPDAIATTQLFPEECLAAFGSNYLPVSYEGGFGQLSELLIVAMENSTQVSITGSGFSDQFTLNELQMFRVDRDASGLHVSGNASLAVFVGVRCANVAPSVDFCDTLYEQIQPQDSLQPGYIIPSLLPRKNIYLRVIGTTDATTVQVQKRTAGVVENSDFVVNDQTFVDTEYMNTDALALLASAPVVVGKFGYGGNQDLLLYGDPALLIAPAIPEFTDKYVLYGPATLGFNRMAIITKPEYIDGLRLNGYPLTGTLGNVTVTANYTILYEEMCYGVHQLHHVKGKPFGVLQYNMEYYREATNAPRRLYPSVPSNKIDLF